MINLMDLILSHTANLTDEDDNNMTNIWAKIHTDDFDFANFALRTCTCSKAIDGFYEYQDHLLTTLLEAAQ